MEAQKANSHRVLWGFAVLLLVFAAAWIGWSQGDKSTQPSDWEPPPPSFRVAGSSMVPTLYGPSLQIKCPGCGQKILFDAQSLGRMEESLICSLCGEGRRISGLNDTAGLTAYAGDIVQISESDDAGYEIGELVAIQWQGSVRVKRVVATAGDEVDITRLHVLVNGQRVEDRLAAEPGTRRPPDLLVDDDSLRALSRWTSATAAEPWRRDADRRWSCDQEQNSPWLLYHHQNVHDHRRPSGVMDDYQYNAGIARQLVDVDRLSLSGTLKTEQPVTLRAAFWSHDGVVIAEKRIEKSGRFRIRFYDGVPGNDSPVTKEAPLAIRVHGGPTSLASLQIHRAIEYRLRADDERSQYPLRIPKAHYYVVGDNVPFSIDSRTLGAVESGSILGRVQILETAASDR